MHNINEDKIATEVIDLNANAEKKLDESFLRMFGNFVKMVMKRTFGGEDVAIPVTVKGSRSQIDDFAKTLAREKRYLETYKKYGLDDPRTYYNKYELDSAIKRFELNTGLKWPFK